MRTLIIAALLVLFSMNGVVSAAEDDIFEIEAEGSYRMEAGAPIDLAKEVALFTAKRKAVDIAGRYLSRKKTVGNISTYRVRIKARVQASDFVKAEMQDTKQEKKEAKESFHEEMEQHVFAEIDPGRDIAKAYRLLREKKWRIAMIYLNHLEKNTRTGTASIWPKP